MSRKLIDDCFLTDKERMRHDDALALLRARVSAVTGRETVPLASATGRLLAETVVAGHPVPSHTNAAVDGFAFAYRDYDRQLGAKLEIAGRAAAGHPLAGEPPPASAVRIFTGAVMPAGLDTVVMQEDVDVSGGEGEGGAVRVAIPGGLKPGANVRMAGEDVPAGVSMMSEGHRLRPQDIAGLASIGRADVSCFAPLRVAVVSTGDEVVRPGVGSLAAGQVFDANAPMLVSLARLTGAVVTDLGVWPDEAGEVRRRLLEAAGRHDIVLTSGGASRGEEDHMVSAIEALGQRHLWQLAVKPGRPMSFGQVGDTVVLGLPGNPVAVFVCFLMYACPLLGRLGGGAWREPRRYRLPALFEVAKRKTGRREFWRGIVQDGADGPAVDKFAYDGSGLITGLRAADGLIDVKEDREAVRPGEMVDFIPFSEFGIVA